MLWWPKEISPGSNNDVLKGSWWDSIFCVRCANKCHTVFGARGEDSRLISGLGFGFIRCEFRALWSTHLSVWVITRILSKKKKAATSDVTITPWQEWWRVGWIISATPLAVSDLVVTNDMLQLSTDLLLDGVCESYKVCFSHCVGIFFFLPTQGWFSSICGSE